MSDKELTKQALIPSTNPESALDIAAFVGSAIPWIGGPVSNVLGGMSMGRKLTRVREFLLGLSSDLSGFKSEISCEYVKTEDFEDLLEQTLKWTAEERNEEKRRVYRAFLTDAIKSPGEPFDEQIRFLRTFEAIQGDHLRVLRALSQDPNPDVIPGTIGSPNQTLGRRLPDLGETHVNDLIAQLNDFRITNLPNLRITITGHGAEDLRRSITAYGQRFLHYLLEA